MALITHIKERYPALTGSALAAQIDRDYLIGRGISLTFWLDELRLQPRFTRHPDNRRNECQTRSLLIESLEQHGWLSQARGSPIAVPAAQGDYHNERLMLVAGATLTEALYESSKKSVVSQNVEDSVSVSVASGIPAERALSYSADGSFGLGVNKHVYEAGTLCPSSRK
jgi:hypothetical protein